MMTLPSGAALPSYEEISRERQQIGNVSDKYTWSYAEDEVTIEVPLEPGLSKKDIKVVLVGNQSLSITVAGEEILSGTLFQEVEPEEMTYTSTSSKLTVELTMKQKMTWQVQKKYFIYTYALPFICAFRDCSHRQCMPYSRLALLR